MSTFLQAVIEAIETAEIDVAEAVEKALHRNPHHCHHHRDPIVTQHQGVPAFTLGVTPMSAAFNLPFDQIATVTLFATRASSQLTNVLPGSTIASDNASVVVALAADGNSYTATATTKAGSANITLSPPAGSTVPADVAVCNIVDDAVVSQGQNTGTATFAANPSPPTA